jgi:hypothetical protein
MSKGFFQRSQDLGRPSFTGVAGRSVVATLQLPLIAAGTWKVIAVLAYGVG